MTSKFIIYALIDPRTSKTRYIGQSTNGLYRPKSHAAPGQLSRDRTHKGMWIKSLRREGLAYEIHILEEVAELGMLDAAEIQWIADGRAQGWPLINHVDGDGGIRGYHYTEETKAKVSASLMGRKMPPEAIAKTAAFWRGHKHSDEARAKMSEAKKGIIPTDEARARMSEAQKKVWSDPAYREMMSANKRGKPLSPQAHAATKLARTGKPRTAEAKANISAACRRPDRVEKMRAANLGRVDSAETRARMSEAQKNRAPMSEETRARMSAAHKERHRLRREAKQNPPPL